MIAIINIEDDETIESLYNKFSRSSGTVELTRSEKKFLTIFFRSIVNYRNMEKGKNK